MQLSNSLFSQTTFLVCVFFFLTFGSSTDAAGGIRKVLPKKTSPNGSGSASNANSGHATTAPQPKFLRSPFVLPSGQNENGQFVAKKMVNLIPYKQDAIHFYKSRSTSLYDEIAEFIHYLDLLAMEFPENKKTIMQWQRKTYPKSPTPTFKVGVLSAAFKQNDLSFLNTILGASIVAKLKLNYQFKLPTSATFSFPNEIVTGLKNVWLFLRRIDKTFFKKSFSTSGVILIADIHGLRVHYPPMFDLSSVDSTFKTPNVLAGSYKGITIGQFKRFFQAMHEYTIMRFHELIMSTLPDPDSETQAFGVNIFKKPISGTRFNLALNPGPMSSDGQRIVRMKFNALKDMEKFVQAHANADKESLLQELNELASTNFPFKTHFENLRSTLNAKSTSLNYELISETLSAVKKNIRVLPNVRRLFRSFSITDQYHSFKSATYTLVRDYLKVFGSATHKVYGNKKYGLQLELFGNDQVRLIYESILRPAQFRKFSTNDKLARLIGKIDFYLLNWYISDFQKILTEQKKIQVCFSPQLPAQANSKGIPNAEKPKPRRVSQLDSSSGQFSETYDSFEKSIENKPKKETRPSIKRQSQKRGSQIKVNSGKDMNTKPRRQNSQSKNVISKNLES